MIALREANFCRSIVGELVRKGIEPADRRLLDTGRREKACPRPKGRWAVVRLFPTTAAPLPVGKNHSEVVFNAM